MKKLDEQYWEEKFDSLLPGDAKVIVDAFESGSFKPEEKVALAVLLLQGITVITSDEFNKVYSIANKFNNEFAYEPLFATDFRGDIYCIRYNYRKFLNCIPSAVAEKAITLIYSRLGLTLDDKDIADIGIASSIYSKFLEYAKKECGNNKYFYFSEDMTEDCAQDAINLMWLNTYILFGKLGLENLNMFKVLGSMGTTCVPYTAFSFKEIDKELNDAILSVYKATRDKIYVTEQETSIVASI